MLLILPNALAKMWMQSSINFKGIKIDMLEMKPASTLSLKKCDRERSNSRSCIKQAAASICIRKKAGHESSRFFRRKKLTKLRFLIRFGVPGNV